MSDPLRQDVDLLKQRSLNGNGGESDGTVVSLLEAKKRMRVGPKRLRVKKKGNVM